jgi:hypothetical protein
MEVVGFYRIQCIIFMGDEIAAMAPITMKPSPLNALTVADCSKRNASQ